MNHYHTSTGERVTQGQIDARLKKSYRQNESDYVCQSRGVNCQTSPCDHDHSISQKRCKELHKAELIYDPENWVISCRACHSEHESWKSGLNQLHKNYTKRMEYMKKHDPEGYRARED